MIEIMPFPLAACAGLGIITVVPGVSLRLPDRIMEP
jgi:hypothetical protein